jgi:hypothetical protein
MIKIDEKKHRIIFVFGFLLLVILLFSISAVWFSNVLTGKQINTPSKIDKNTPSKFVVFLSKIPIVNWIPGLRQKDIKNRIDLLGDVPVCISDSEAQQKLIDAVKKCKNSVGSFAGYTFRIAVTVNIDNSVKKMNANLECYQLELAGNGGVMQERWTNGDTNNIFEGKCIGFDIINNTNSGISTATDTITLSPGQGEKGGFYLVLGDSYSQVIRRQALSSDVLSQFTAIMNEFNNCLPYLIKPASPIEPDNNAQWYFFGLDKIPDELATRLGGKAYLQIKQNFQAHSQNGYTFYLYPIFSCAKDITTFPPEITATPILPTTIREKQEQQT